MTSAPRGRARSASAVRCVVVSTDPTPSAQPVPRPRAHTRRARAAISGLALVPLGRTPLEGGAFWLLFALTGGVGVASALSEPAWHSAPYVWAVLAALLTLAADQVGTALAVRAARRDADVAAVNPGDVAALLSTVALVALTLRGMQDRARDAALLSRTQWDAHIALTRMQREFSVFLPAALGLLAWVLLRLVGRVRLSVVHRGLPYGAAAVESRTASLAAVFRALGPAEPAAGPAAPGAGSPERAKPLPVVALFLLVGLMQLAFATDGRFPLLAAVFLALALHGMAESGARARTAWGLPVRGTRAAQALVKLALLGLLGAFLWSQVRSGRPEGLALTVLLAGGLVVALLVRRLRR